MYYNRIIDLGHLQPVKLDHVNMGTLDDESMTYFFHLVSLTQKMNMCHHRCALLKITFVPPTPSIISLFEFSSQILLTLALICPFAHCHIHANPVIWVACYLNKVFKVLRPLPN